MKIPFLFITAAFTTGVISQKYLLRLPPAAFLLMPGLLFALLFFRGRRPFIPLFLSGLFLSGSFYGALDERSSPDSLGKILEDNFSGRVWIEGTVKTEPEVKITEKKKRLSFVLDAVRLEKRTSEKEKIPVSGAVQVFIYQSGALPESGDYVGISGSLERPDPAMNPGEFDYRNYLARSRIDYVLTGYGKRSLYIFRQGPVYSPKRAVGRLRKAVGARIEKVFGGEEAGFMKALILGDKKQISPVWKNQFLKTGTSHLLAISGLNIALLAGSVYFLMILAGLGQKSAAFFALIITMVQVLIAGGGIPVQRAGWMAGCAFLGIMLERPVSLLNGLFFSFLLLLVLDVRSLEDISFQLSYLSLFCLIASPVIRNKYWSWTNFALTSAVVLVGTAPVVLYHFNSISILSILGNLFAIPMFHLALLAGFSAIAVPEIAFLSGAAAGAAEFFLNLGLGWIRFCSRSGWGYFFFPKPTFFEIVFYYFGLLILLLPVKIFRRPGWKNSLTVLCITISLGSFAVRHAEKREFSMTVLSSGQSGAAHAQLGPGRHWLIESGRGWSGSQAQWTLSPYLQSLGVQNLSGVIHTDFRTKNPEGLGLLRENFGFEYFFAPLWGKRNSEIEQEERKLLSPGDKIRVRPGASMEVLGVVEGRFILGINYSDWTILLVPASGSEVIKKLQKIDSAPWACAVIFPPEVKLDPESWRQMLDAMDPQVIVASGVNPRIEEEAALSGIKIFDLKIDGAVSFSPQEEILKVISLSGEKFRIVKRA